MRIHLPLLFTGLMVFSAFAEKVGTPPTPSTFIIEPSDADSPLAVDKAKDEADLQKMREIDRVLRETKIPKVEFRDATLDQQLSFLSQKTGVRFINASLLPEADAPTVTLSVQNIDSRELLRYITQLTGNVAEVTPESVFIIPLLGGRPITESREYRVSVAAMVRLVKKAGFEVNGATEANFLKSPPSLRQCFEKLGISFHRGCYDSRTETLIVGASEGVFEVLEAILVENDVDQRIMSAIQRQMHRLSQKLLKKVEIRSATIQEIIDGIANDLPDPLLFVQRDGITLKPSRPVGRILRLEGDDLMPSALSRSSRPKAAPSPQDLRLNFSLENVTLFEFLQELARQTDTELIVGMRHIFMVPPSILD